MLRLLLPLALALFLVADASAQTHTVSITYERAERGLSDAQVTVAPRDARAQAPWRGDVSEMAVLSTRGVWVRITDLERSGDGVAAKAMLPPPSEIAILLVRGERGPWIGWKVEEDWPNLADAKWTVLAQDGEQAEAEEPECDFSGCSTTAIRDPYTCECIEDIRDPWGDEATTESVIISI